MATAQYSPAEDTFRNQTAAREQFFANMRPPRPGPPGSAFGTPANTPGSAPSPPGAPTFGSGQTPSSQVAGIPGSAFGTPANTPPVSTAGPAATAPGPGAFNEQALRDAWSGTPDHSPENLARLAAQFGATVVSPDKIRLPDGRIIDAIMDVGGANNPGWIDTSVAGGVSSGSTGAGQPAGAPGAPGAGLGAPASAPAGDPFQSQIRQLLLEQLGKFGKDPSIDDPALKGQSDAFRRATERAAQQSRSQAAERAAFQGLNPGGAGSGAFETTLQGIREGVGERTGAFDAGLVGQEVQQRRGALQNLLQMALSSGDAESARAIQMQIAQMDDSLRRATLAQQQTQFDTGLDFDRTVRIPSSLL